MPYFHNQDVSLYFELHGQGVETVVFLNGIIMSTKAWKPQLLAFSQRYQVLLTDFRGQGASTLRDEEHTYEQHLDDLKSLLDHLGLQRVHLVGTSYGAEIAVMFAARHPHQVQTLTLSGATAYPDELLRMKVRAWSIAAEDGMRLGRKADFFRIMAPFNFSARFMQARPDFFEKQAQFYDQLPDELYHSFIRLCECFMTLDIRDDLAKVRVRTLVIAGMHDELKPVSCSRVIADGIPRARLVLLDAGHAMVIEQAREFNYAVLSFLAANPIELPRHMPGRALYANGA